MNIGFKNFIKRSLSAALLVPIIIFGIYWSQWFYFWYYCVILIAATREFHQMFAIFVPSVVDRVIGKLFGVVLYLVAFLYSKLSQEIYFLESQDIILTRWMYLLPVFMLAFFVKKLYSSSDIMQSMQQIFFTLFPVLYIAVPFAIMHFGVFSNGEYNCALLFTTIFGVWANDTGAYIFGSLFGKHKLFEKISKNKTWEGAAGGLLFTIITTYICSFYFAGYMTGYNCLFIGTIVSVSSVYGDLFESMIKRAAGVKDSGTIIPGHGGVLDRFDSFLFAIVCVVAYVKFFGL